MGHSHRALARSWCIVSDGSSRGGQGGTYGWYSAWRASQSSTMTQDDRELASVSSASCKS